MGQGLTSTGDGKPSDLGEVAEADLSGLTGQRKHRLRRQAMLHLPISTRLYRVSFTER